MTSTLRTLLDRVEKGEGADRYVDACLELMLTPELGEAPWTQPSIGKWVDGACADNIVYAPAYTSSIDAAVALVEKVLPGFRYGFNAQPQKLVQAWVEDDTPQDQPDFAALAKSPARALVSALLRAKITQEERT